MYLLCNYSHSTTNSSGKEQQHLAVLSFAIVYRRASLAERIEGGMLGGTVVAVTMTMIAPFAMREMMQQA